MNAGFVERFETLNVLPQVQNLIGVSCMNPN